MKTFRDYLTESARQYEYRIKFAGETSTDFFSSFEQALAKFDVTKFGEPKKSPVMKSLPGFPDLENQEMYIVDVVLNYPANDEQLRQVAVSLGKSPDHVVVITPAYDDANTAAAKTQEANSGAGSLLTTPLDAQSPEQKAASDEYARGQTTAAINSVKTEFKFAGKTAEKAKTTNDLEPNTTSPLTKVQRPAKPATGASRGSE